MLRTRTVADGPAVTPARRVRLSPRWGANLAAVSLVAGLVAYLALTPIAPFAADPAGSEARRHLILSAAFAGYAVLLLATRRLPLPSPLDVPVLIVLGAIALAVWGSVDRRLSLEWLLAALPAAPLAVILRDRRLLSPDHLRRGVMAGAAVAAIFALASVWRQWQDWLELVRVIEGGISVASVLPPTVPRVAGVGSHPNVLAAVLALSLPFFVFTIAGGRRAGRIGGGAGLIVVGAALFFTLSRAAWMGAALGCGVTSWAALGGRLPARRRWLAVAAGVVAVAGLGMALLGGARPDWLFRDSLDPRADMRRVGLEVARDHLLTGAGPGMYPLLYAAHSGTFPFAAVHAHTTIIQIAADTGIVGLAASALLLGTAGWLILPALVRGAAARRRGVAIPAGALTAFLVHGLADAPHLYPEVLTMLAAALVLLPAGARNNVAANPLPVGDDAVPPGGFGDGGRGEPRRAAYRFRPALGAAVPALVLLVLGLELVPLWWWNDRGAALHQEAVRTTAADQHDAGIRLAERAVAWDGRQTAHRAQLAAALSSRFGHTGNPADRDRAILEYQRLLAAQPYHAAGLVDLAALLLARGDVVEARAVVERLGRLTGGDRLLQAAHAALVEQTGTTEEAITVYAGLLAIDPTLAATPLFHTGFRQAHTEAIIIRAQERAAELAPAGPALANRRQAILVYAGRAAPDEAVIRQLLAAQPNDTATLVALGRVLLAAGRTEEAEVNLRRAVARTADSVDAREALGAWFAARGELTAARHEWMIAGWLGSARALDALGESYPAGQVPAALVARQRQALAAVSAVRFGLLAQNQRFAFGRKEPAPVIARGDWLLTLPDEYYRWSANLDRWDAERSAAR